MYVSRCLCNGNDTYKQKKLRVTQDDEEKMSLNPNSYKHIQIMQLRNSLLVIPSIGIYYFTVLSINLLTYQ